MSAFIVDDETMHRAVTGYHRAMSKGSPNSKALTELGRKWFAMNQRAVEQRYREQHETPAGEGYAFKYVDANSVDYYKALRCLRYQCSEGDVPESPEFQELCGVIDGLGYSIISKLPEFERAKW